MIGIFDRLRHMTGAGRKQTGTGIEECSDDDGRAAVASLLVAAAAADGRYDETERALIGRILAVTFSLDDAAAERLRRTGEERQEKAADMFQHTRRIKKTFSFQQRLGILDAMWSVVLSDGERHPHEEALIRQGASLLGLSDRDRVHSRQRIAARMAEESG